MIRVRLAPAAIERVAVAYSPLTECLLSLRLLLKPALHPLHRHWARALRSLPPPLLAAIDKLAFAFTDDVPVFVAGGTRGSPPFAAELERLRSMPPAAIRYQFTRGLHHGALTQAQLNRSAVRRRLLEAAGSERTADQEPLELVLERPQVFLAWFSELIAAYFEQAFVKEWERIEPLLAESVEDAARRLANDGLFKTLPQLSARLRGDPQRGEIEIAAFAHGAWELTGEERLVLVPSVYAWPNLMTSLDDGAWRKVIVYPAPFLAEREVEPLPPADLQRLLRALGDNTRLSVLRLVAEQPRSTRELAPLVGISEATLSRHLRVLTEARAVSRRREGRFVLYALEEERLAQLEPGLLRYLHGQE